MALLSFFFILAYNTDVMAGASAAILDHEVILYYNPYTRMMEQKDRRLGP